MVAAVTEQEAESGAANAAMMFFHNGQFNSIPIQFNSIPIQFNSIPIQFNSNSIQFNSIQFNSIQFNSIQFNSIQFNSIQFQDFLTSLRSGGDHKGGAQPPP